LSALKCQIRD
jgi:hypothetical protein